MTGISLPLISVFFNFVFMNLTAVAFFSPIISTGCIFQRNSIPSSFEFLTSLFEPGMFDSFLLYAQYTFFAPCLRAVLLQSIAVSPPPRTITVLSLRLIYSLSSFFIRFLILEFRYGNES